ncbi:AbrB/MazE/SpoVT family DNA-binding domain-containing protein [Candidatus Saccharibacteria bacterium]|nr:AbrB/MazE/SpoVT family DNA-binding domain-containing protein [Candidatus Saccharibacteria bacterium]MCB9834438.1 AbrB/MazE/SpoVT family DNA-binding domain-containing protein [Candidatus Nomurabacteria bacterium]
MVDTITMTSKGTFTMPIKFRQQLGVNKLGDRLTIDFDESGRKVIISRPESFKDISQFVQSNIAKVKPLKDPAEYYQKNRPVSNGQS